MYRGCTIFSYNTRLSSRYFVSSSGCTTIRQFFTTDSINMKNIKDTDNSKDISNLNSKQKKSNPLNQNQNQPISNNDQNDQEGRNEQTVSGSIHQISHSTTAYDRETSDPHQEIQEMKRKNHQVKTNKQIYISIRVKLTVHPNYTYFFLFLLLGFFGLESCK